MPTHLTRRQVTVVLWLEIVGESGMGLGWRVGWGWGGVGEKWWGCRGLVGMKVVGVGRGKWEKGEEKGKGRSERGKVGRGIGRGGSYCTVRVSTYLVLY